MTDQAKCLPGCVSSFGLHDIGCPNAEPAPAPGCMCEGNVTGDATHGPEECYVNNPNPAPTPAPAGVTPASDADIKSWRFHNDPVCEGMMTVGLPAMHTDKRGMLRLIARIEQEKAANAELQAEVERLKAQLDDESRRAERAFARGLEWKAIKENRRRR